MKKYIILNKKVGETPLSVLEKYRRENPSFKDIPMAYAGRLDPMANGKLLILIGDECKNQKSYFGLDKEYTFEVLLGFSSDTGDILGLSEYEKNKHFNDGELEEVTKKFVGNISLPYPKFSSKTVQGKPLFLWTLEKRLDEIEIPHKDSVIYNLTYKGSRTLHKKDLHSQILEKINSLPEVKEESKALGKDFRRNDIRARWEEVFQNTDEDAFQIATFSCICSSGTYMRTLAGVIGKELGTEGLAFGIHRTKIGRYKKVFKNLGFWRKNFS